MDPDARSDVNDSPPAGPGADPEPGGAATTSRELYWRANLRWVVGLLVLWFLVSFGAGILFAPELNEHRLPGSGFKVGFWFAQQGSIFSFVLIVFVYVRVMNRLDRHFGVDEKRPRSGGSPGAEGEAE